MLIPDTAWGIATSGRWIGRPMLVSTSWTSAVASAHAWDWEQGVHQEKKCSRETTTAGSWSGGSVSVGKVLHLQCYDRDRL